MRLWNLSAGIGAALCGAVVLAQSSSLREQNEQLFSRLRQVHRLSDQELADIRRIFEKSGYIGQGNPAITRHPVTPEACRDHLRARNISYANPRFGRICQAPYMAPLYDPSRQRPEDARACIDQFEFPDIPCEYPVVWVRAHEAAEICSAEGKRLCDTHEWEGACDGRLEEPDYRFDLAQGGTPNDAVARMRAAHNRKYEATKSWSYGSSYRSGVCGTSSRKSPDCPGGNWATCGSNTFPDGNLPDCRSPLEVFDLNGNAAEHMNLPLNADQMASRGSRELGYTEMKGSWFIFDTYRAHEDWCRWRAPYWHGSRVMAEQSHANYHLSFRCCKTIE
jgi:hypothetical protein